MLRRWYKDIRYFSNCLTLSELQKGGCKMLIGADNQAAIRDRRQVISGLSKVMEEENELKLEKESDLISTNETLDVGRENEANI